MESILGLLESLKIRALVSILTYLVPAEDHSAVVPVVQGVPGVRGVDPTRAEQPIQQAPPSCNSYTVKKVTIFYTVKKGTDFPVPSRDVINQTFPGWE